MKRSLIVLSIVLIAVISCIFVSCDQGDSIDFKVHNAVSKDKIYYASRGLNDFTLRSVKGTGFGVADNADEIPGLFVVKGSDLASLSDEDTILAVKTVLEGKAFVVEMPTIKQLDDFWDKINDLLSDDQYEYLRAEHEMSPYTIYKIIELYGSDEDYTASSDEHVYEAIGLRQGHVYFVHDIDEIVDAESGHTYKGTEAKKQTYHYDDEGNKILDSEEPGTISGEDLPDDWEEIVATTIDCFSKWLKSKDVSETNDAGSREIVSGFARSVQADLNDIVKAQSAVFSYTMAFGYRKDSHYDGRMDGKKEVVQAFIDVWTACDVENQKEYYLVRYSVVYNNQQLGYHNGWSYDNQSGYIGPYFNAGSLNVSLPGSYLRTTDCKPENNQKGSTSFTTGSGYSLSGNIGVAGSGPTGGVMGNVSVNESTTRSIPDITITFTPTTETEGSGDPVANPANASWNFNTPDVYMYEDVNYWFNGHHNCDGAKPIQHTAATFDTYAVFTRSSSYKPEEKTAMFKVGLTTSLGVTVFYKKNFMSIKPNQADYFHKKWVHHNIPFTRPSNLSEQYIMRVSSGTNLSHMEEIIKEFFPEWASNVTYYAFGDVSHKYDVLDSVAKNAFTKVKQKVNDNKNLFENRDLSGEYTLVIQRVDGGDIVSSFSLTI